MLDDEVTPPLLMEVKKTRVRYFSPHPSSLPSHQRIGKDECGHGIIACSVVSARVEASPLQLISLDRLG